MMRRQVLQSELEMVHLADSDLESLIGTVKVMMRRRPPFVSTDLLS